MDIQTPESSGMVNCTIWLAEYIIQSYNSVVILTPELVLALYMTSVIGGRVYTGMHSIGNSFSRPRHDTSLNYLQLILLEGVSWVWLVGYFGLQLGIGTRHG